MKNYKKWLALLLIWKVLGSNLGPETGMLVVLLRPSTQVPGSNLNSATSVYLKLIVHLPPYHRVWYTDDVVK
jgi:hypothetical protein